MTQSMFEQSGEQIADTAYKASRAASAVVEVLEDGVGAGYNEMPPVGTTLCRQHTWPLVRQGSC